MLLHAVTCLLHVAGDEDEELEVKQQQVSRYEHMQVTAILHTGNKDTSDPNFSETGTVTSSFIMTFDIHFVYQDANVYLLSV